ncbi:MAG: hypothetical protein CL609_07310 [Anaerolineaceae bacterium]|nr:hypothetical protein [Anaerolineaceae bacterium]
MKTKTLKVKTKKSEINLFVKESKNISENEQPHHVPQIVIDKKSNKLIKETIFFLNDLGI